MFTVKVCRLNDNQGQNTWFYTARSVQVIEGPDSDRDLMQGDTLVVVNLHNDDPCAIAVPGGTPVDDRKPGQVVAVIIENMDGKTSEVIR